MLFRLRKICFKLGTLSQQVLWMFELSLETDEINVSSGAEEEVEIQGCFKWMEK